MNRSERCRRSALRRKCSPHTNPDQIMRFVNGKGRLLAEIAPSQRPFGWPRRSCFIQPLVDAELLKGLYRFDCVNLRWSRSLESFEVGDSGVTARFAAPDGSHELIEARYLVGSDGGRSTTRRLGGISFEGTTSSTRWVVVDLRTDPLGSPNVTVGADPERPFVSVSLAHGVRRFEFMLHDDEPDEQVDDPAFLGKLLSRHIPRPLDVDVIRRRVYTHHSRIAGAFRSGPILLAGDAAHLMPVWQGQGYNSGIRDAVNLGWKLATVTKGLAGDELLDTYDQERRPHARSMIDLSTLVGKWVSPTSKRVATVRDIVLIAASSVPVIKSYLVEMRFKPMPRYTEGAVTYLHAPADDGAVGRQFIQPQVSTRSQPTVLLDDVTGPWFSVLSWNNDPFTVLGDEAERWLALGAKLIALRPQSQLNWTVGDHEEVTVVGDSTGALKQWFDVRSASVVFLRPDRFVAGACIAQNAPEVSGALFDDALSIVGDDRHVHYPTASVAQTS